MERLRRGIELSRVAGFSFALILLIAGSASPHGAEKHEPSPNPAGQGSGSRTSERADPSRLETPTPGSYTLPPLGESGDGLVLTSDGEPVRLVFLIISPIDDPDGHLATLAEVARLVANPAVRNALIDAHSLPQVIDIVRRAMG